MNVSLCLCLGLLFRQLKGLSFLLTKRRTIVTISIFAKYELGMLTLFSFHTPVLIIDSFFLLLFSNFILIFLLRTPKVFLCLFSHVHGEYINAGASSSSDVMLFIICFAFCSGFGYRTSLLSLFDWLVKREIENFSLLWDCYRRIWSLSFCYWFRILVILTYQICCFFIFIFNPERSAG